MKNNGMIDSFDTGILGGWIKYGSLNPNSLSSIRIELHNRRFDLTAQAVRRQDVSDAIGFRANIFDHEIVDALTAPGVRIQAYFEHEGVPLGMYQNLVLKLRQSGYSPYSSRKERNTFCVFSSVGDFNNVEQWVQGDQLPSWDLSVAYYGADMKEMASIAFYARETILSKGGKFQNARNLMSKNPDIFKPYEFVMLADDDLIMTSSQIEEAFLLAKRYDLWVSSPSFSKQGVISFSIMQPHEGSDLRFVNFVEVTCPIFRRDKLEEFLRSYDGSLPGYGVDYWYSNYFALYDNFRAGIFDTVVIQNPTDSQRRGQVREITKLASNEERMRTWSDVRLRHHLIDIQPSNLAFVRARSL